MKDTTNMHSGHRARLRNMIKNGDMSKLQDYQLLEFLLTFSIPRKDTNELAHRLVKQFGSLVGVLEADPEFLMKVDGIGENSAIFLSTIPKICNEYKIRRQIKKVSLKNSLQMLSFCINVLEQKPIEEIYLIMLDSHYCVQNYLRIASGTVDKAYSNTREITQIALKNNAHYVLVAHNHPNGKPEPSYMDDKFTKTVTMALTLNGVNMIDHFIIGSDNSYYSYRDKGLIDEYVDEINKKQDNV